MCYTETNLFGRVARRKSLVSKGARLRFAKFILKNHKTSGTMFTVEMFDYNAQYQL